MRLWMTLIRQPLTSITTCGGRVQLEKTIARFARVVKTGQPTVKGAKVTAEIVGEAKGKKLFVFKFKRRKNYRRKTGHRQKYTEIKITGVKV